MSTTSRTSPAFLAFLSLTSVGLSSCIGSTLLDAEHRAVEPKVIEHQWRPAVADTIPGQYESVEVRGEAAGAMLKVYYFFMAGGRYTGAALVVDRDGPSFQVLTGRWQLVDGQLTLGEDTEPARAEMDGSFLRISTDTGTLVLRRVTQ